MQSLRRHKTLIVILLFAAAFATLAASWFVPAVAFPRAVWSQTLAPWLIAKEDLLRAVAAVLSITGFFIGLLVRRSRKAAERRETPPLTSVSLDDLFARYGRGFTVPWLPRDATFPLHLHGGSRILLAGPSEQGKTRSALELLRAAVDATLVGKGRIYEPDAYAFSTRSASTLAQQIRSSIDPYSPLAVFIDDLPVHFTGATRRVPKGDAEPGEAQFEELNDLENLAAALDVLAGYKACYVVATARPEDMRPGIHEPWLQSHGFLILTLRDITPAEQEKIFARAAETWGLEVDRSALRAMRAQYTGAAGLPVRTVGLHAATKHGPVVTEGSVKAVSAAANRKGQEADSGQVEAKARFRMGAMDDLLLARVASARRLAQRLAASVCWAAAWLRGLSMKRPLKRLRRSAVGQDQGVGQDRDAQPDHRDESS